MKRAEMSNMVRADILEWVHDNDEIVAALVLKKDKVNGRLYTLYVTPFGADAAIIKEIQRLRIGEKPKHDFNAKLEIMESWMHILNMV